MTESMSQGGVTPALAAAFGATLPSLDWVLAELTGVWVAANEMISCPLPGHDDSTPSFNLWAPNDEGVPERFGCFGCGRRGDVVDLVMELEGLEQDAAYTRCFELAAAEREAPTPERAKTPQARPAASPQDLTARYDAIVAGMRQAEFDVFSRFMREKGLGGEELEQYAMEDWGWTATRERAIVMPHRGPDGALTGIKYRARDRKWNEPGSRFPNLYGIWRGLEAPTVVLCEGESDTLWAAWSLRDEEDIAVLGLPSGAMQQLNSDWLAVLEGKSLVLAFDADKAGMDAARRWHAARGDVLLARLPEGEDLLSCGIPVHELLDRATQPRRHSGMIQIQGDVFGKSVKDAVVPVADFAFQPVRELFTADGPAWEGNIVGDRNLSLIRASDLLSGTTVTRWANRHGRAWTGGSGPAVQGVFNWLAAESAFLPLERATTKAGKIGRSYVGPGFCIGADRIRYIPPATGDAKLESKLHIADDEWDPQALRALENLNNPGTMATILGWLMATLIRGERAPAPPLFVAGESGAGKTNLLATVLDSFGFATEVNLTTTTPYGVDCLVSSCIGFPVWFDEYRGGAREDSMMRLRQLLRDAYYGQPSMKGGMTSNTTELTEITTWAGMIVSGEMSSYETSHRDRMVMLDLSPDDRNRETYTWLQNKRRTTGLGHALLTFLSRRPDTLFNVSPQGNPETSDRFRDTLGFVQTGWDAWLHFRWMAGLRDTPVEPDLAALEHGRANVEDPWLEALKVCEGIPTRGTPSTVDAYTGAPLAIVSQTDEGVLLIASEVVIEARRAGIELPARANELVTWLKRRYKVVDKRVGSRRAKLAVGMKLEDA
jgi:hypothetical protein